jgi:hypothetical protein
MSQTDRGTNRTDPASLSSRQMLVVGVVRNCAAQIKADVTRLKVALRRFRRVHWLLIESDSDDASVAKLRDLSSELSDFRFISLGSLRAQLPRRSERISFCRNAYLKEIRTNENYQAVDFVIVADFDGVNSLITEDAILSCWERDDWNVCAANQQGPYYDIWALRHKAWSPNDCSAQYRFLVHQGVGPERALSVSVHSRMIPIAKDGEWIEVESAFGGLAIYRRRALDKGEYAGLDGDGHEVCEHVALHGDIKAKIFINPRLINAARTEHAEALLIRNKIVRVIRRTIRRLLTAGRVVGRRA